MRVLIVDDEAPARRRLRQLLAAIGEVEVVGEAADGEAALALVEQLHPELLLLDVQMPELDGLAVAASLPDGGPAVIFVTAHDAYAVQAFDAQALDYLLKPVAAERLARAIERARRQAPPRAAVSASRLLVPTRQGLQVLPSADIDWLEAADNYVTLHAGPREYLLRRTLTGLLADLGDGFVRVHRGAAVALAQVTSVQSNDKGDARITLRSGEEVACSRAYRAALLQRLAAGG